jgi:hypothetical protein
MRLDHRHFLSGVTTDFALICYESGHYLWDVEKTAITDGKWAAVAVVRELLAVIRTGDGDSGTDALDAGGGGARAGGGVNFLTNGGGLFRFRMRLRGGRGREKMGA